MIRVFNRQSAQEREVRGPKTVGDLLKELNLVEGAVLVMRGGELLTRDVRILDGEKVEIIPVVSGG
ncbi:MAG: MoaD/ThiS family protein [Thermodesulfobacteriota bacterium]